MKDPKEQQQPQRLPTDEAVVPIKYIGNKDEKHDTVNHTGEVWKRGETRFYPTRYAKALLVHTAVWRLGKREDVGKVSEDHMAVVAASAPGTDGDLEFEEHTIGALNLALGIEGGTTSLDLDAYTPLARGVRLRARAPIDLDVLGGAPRWNVHHDYELDLEIEAADLQQVMASFRARRGTAT